MWLEPGLAEGRDAVAPGFVQEPSFEDLPRVAATGRSEGDANSVAVGRDIPEDARRVPSVAAHVAWYLNDFVGRIDLEGAFDEAGTPSEHLAVSAKKLLRQFDLSQAQLSPERYATIFYELNLLEIFGNRGKKSPIFLQIG